MKKHHKLALLAAAVPCLSFQSLSAQRIIFRDEFNGPRNSGTSAQWNRETHRQGRGQFGGDAWIDGNGKAHIGVGRYHPSNNTFSQTAIKTKRSFAPGNKTLDFRIRMKIASDNQPGIVYGFFTYNQYRAGGAMRSDELDFEWLTNRTANRNQDFIQLTTWAYWNRDRPQYGLREHPWHGTHLTQEKWLGFNAADWHTYTMRWKKGLVEWFYDKPDGKWQFIARYRGGAVPSGGQPLFINGWVADSSWKEAFNSSYQPTNNPRQQRWNSMLVDWVRVYER